LSFSGFNSVDDFLRKIREAKNKQRPDIEQFIDEEFSDPYLVGIPPELSDQINEWMFTYGDEPLKQVALYCLSQWYQMHAGAIAELMNNDNHHAALSSTLDMAKVAQSISLLENTGSFGGCEDWKKMLKYHAVGEMNDELNKRDFPDEISPD
jgi:hypothetical protein